MTYTDSGQQVLDGPIDWTGWLGSISVDPEFADADNLDYHLTESSPCIDAGDPNRPIGSEPFPNGSIINLGAYGGTPEATESQNGDFRCDCCQ